MRCITYSASAAKALLFDSSRMTWKEDVITAINKFASQKAKITMLSHISGMCDCH